MARRFLAAEQKAWITAGADADRDTTDTISLLPTALVSFCRGDIAIQTVPVTAPYSPLNSMLSIEKTHSSFYPDHRYGLQRDSVCHAVKLCF